MDASVITVRVPPAEIMFVNNVIESYDHVGLVSTCDERNGIMNLSVSPHRLEEALMILRGLKDEICLEIMEIRP